jgi:ribosomal protein S27AE
MTTSVTFDRSLIAPCGINCGTCMAYLRPRNKCFGCRVDFDSKRKTCNECKIKNCDLLTRTSLEFCYECGIFPCEKMKHIDKRYKSKYRASLIQNLVSIRDIGITSFLKNEGKKWTCPKCGSTLSVHYDKCLKCSYISKINV